MNAGLVVYPLPVITRERTFTVYVALELIFSFLSAFSSLCVATPQVGLVHGRASYQQKIPNGDKVVDSQNEAW